MGLIKITDLTNQLRISSRTLRYYEQAGLITSVRPEFQKYRFYDSENIERLRQIMVLRKMQIPIKDIIHIYQSQDMSVVVEVFVDRINIIDEEVTALSELKRIVNEFLQTMVKNGITKISALPLLYEEMRKQFEMMEEQHPVTYAELSDISERLEKPIEIAIISLPVMRMLTSYLKSNSQKSDINGFWRWVQSHNISNSEPGRHECFEFQTVAGDAVMLKVPDDFENGSEYIDFIFEGGLFAAANVYVDEDLGERLRSLVKSFDTNKFYEIDYTHDGELRHPALLENLISPDEKRELVALYVPVKKRIADPALFEKPEELLPDSITIAEIEAQNLVLWTVDVPLDKLTPINNPHYRVLENGEAEYTGWISTRTLNTNVSVKLPYRVDIEFRLAGIDERFGYGDREGSIIFYHGDEAGYNTGVNLGIMGFGINMDNHSNHKVEAISFHQPIFHDYFNFPKRGKINMGEYNRVTWIIGEKHIVAIINGEIRYCGVNFPYMALDLSREAAYPIVVGSNGQGMKYFKSIRVSQLTEVWKNKIKQGELTWITKQSNNIIPIIHRLITDEYGENYWFNGCARYVMECLGEKDYNYQFFAGLTGDVFAQNYWIKRYYGDGMTAYYLQTNPVDFVESLFAKCGYAATYISRNDLLKNTEMYRQTLVAYIDKGLPVIMWGYIVIVGYEDYGKILLTITGNNNEPKRTPLEEAIAGEDSGGGWIFIGEKKKSNALTDIYRKAIENLPKILTTKNSDGCFGAEAFRAWANDIENGKFDHMKPDEFDQWMHYTCYVCAMATNGSDCHEFLKRARELNPDMSFLEEISHLYKRTGDIWNNDDGKDLEALGGGFNVTLEALQNKDKRSKIAAKIRECAFVIDEVIKILNENIKEC